MVSDQALNGIPKKSSSSKWSHFGPQNRLNVNRGIGVILGQDEFVLTQIRLVSGFYHASLVQMSRLCF